MKSSRYNIIYPYQLNKDYSVVYNTLQDTIGILTIREVEYIKSCRQNLGIHYTRINEFKEKGFIIDLDALEPENTMINPEHSYPFNLLINKLKQTQTINLSEEHMISISETLQEKFGDHFDEFLEKASTIYRLDLLTALGEKYGVGIDEEEAAALIVLMQPAALAV